MAKSDIFFSPLRAPAPIDLWFSVVSSHWNAYYQDPNKRLHAFFLLFKIFFE